MAQEALELTLPVEATSVAQARRAIEEFAQARGACSGSIAAMKLAVSEACSNVVLHAYDGMEPGPLRLCAECRDGRLEVTICDEGRGMRPRVDSPGMGLGLPLIASLAEDLQVDDAEAATRVRMVFRIDREPAAFARAA